MLTAHVNVISIIVNGKPPSTISLLTDLALRTVFVLFKIIYKAQSLIKPKL